VCITESSSVSSASFCSSSAKSSISIGMFCHPDFLFVIVTSSHHSIPEAGSGGDCEGTGMRGGGTGCARAGGFAGGFAGTLRAAVGGVVGEGEREGVGGAGVGGCARGDGTGRCGGGGGVCKGGGGVKGGGES
jgi:hypothetical protein